MSKRQPRSLCRQVYVAEPGRVAEQRCRFSLSDGALLCVLPDLLTCFRDASYRQEQAVRMAGSASLVLLDWFLAGRVANGERWDFTRYAPLDTPVWPHLRWRK